MRPCDKVSRFGILVLIAATAGIAGCAQLKNATPGPGMCQNAEFSLTSDAFPSDQLPLSATQGIAQSFVLQPRQSISGISLRMEGFSPTTPSTLTGIMNVYIVPDASDSTPPTQPNCVSNLGGSSCSGSAIASASLSLPSIAIGQPKFYNLPLSA